ncbi:integrase DNA-binding domain-containing protein [Amedibacillus sp. YH-ame6]
MSEKRRDNKNRISHNGESQRNDGRYMYKYINNAGNRNICIVGIC